MSKSVSPANLMKSTESELVHESSLETDVGTHSMPISALNGYVREESPEGEKGGGTEEKRKRRDGGGVWVRQLFSRLD